MNISYSMLTFLLIALNVFKEINNIVLHCKVSLVMGYIKIKWIVIVSYYIILYVH